MNLVEAKERIGYKLDSAIEILAEFTEQATDSKTLETTAKALASIVRARALTKLICEPSSTRSFEGDQSSCK